MANLEKLFGGYRVENGTNFDISINTLYELYKLGSHGVSGEEPEINSAKGFLQRLAQKQEWNRNQKRRAKSYIKSLIKGSGLLDSFILIPGDLLLDSVKSKMIDADGEALKAWNTVSKYIEERIIRGAKYFIIDGQNRLNESIVPFFNSEFALPEEAIVFVNEDKKREKIVKTGLVKAGYSKDRIRAYLKSIQKTYNDKKARFYAVYFDDENFRLIRPDFKNPEKLQFMVSVDEKIWISSPPS